MHVSLTFAAGQYVKRSRMKKYRALGTCNSVQKKKIRKLKSRGNNELYSSPWKSPVRK